MYDSNTLFMNLRKVFGSPHIFVASHLFFMVTVMGDTHSKFSTEMTNHVSKSLSNSSFIIWALLGFILFGLCHKSFIFKSNSYAPPKSLSSNPYNSWQKDDGTYEVKVEICFLKICQAIPQ